MGDIKKDFEHIDKTHISVRSLNDPDDSVEIYRQYTPEERLQILELLRQIAFGYDPTTERLQRILTVVERK
jgi:hypothetical protein